ncbi:ras-domain-containing protein [Wilcoxina mikolae CBS 423.85]|nr:ras-domain-containing protein [Wilcoxina mikolae CBS 423.85]
MKASVQRMRLYCLCILGDRSVGKTFFKNMFGYCYYLGDAKGWDPYLADDPIRKQIVVDGTSRMVEVTDPSVRPEYREIREAILRCEELEGFILMYSVTSRNTFATVVDYRREIAEIKQMAVEDVTIVLVGNKSDLEDEREVSTAEGEALANELGCLFVETSAKSFDSVERAIHHLVREVDVKRMKKGMLDQTEDTEKGNEKKGNEKKGKRKCTIL